MYIGMSSEGKDGAASKVAADIINSDIPQGLYFGVFWLGGKGYWQ